MKVEFDDLTDSAFARQDVLLTILPFSASQLWRLVREDQFPKPVKLSERVTAWRVRDVRQWLASRPVAGGANPKKRKRKCAPLSRSIVQED